VSHPDRLALAQLNADIEERVQLIRTAHPEWPCAKGCATCCRRLAEVPRLTEAEWDLLQEGIDTLPAALRLEVMRGITALADPPAGPIVCPLLDPASGACRVYHDRPVACRSYGFYVHRDQGLYCKSLESRVAAGEWADVVWGNQDAVDRRLDGLGQARGLADWLQLRDREQVRGAGT
jgi:uncharacterized protein